MQYPFRTPVSLAYRVSAWVLGAAFGFLVIAAFLFILLQGPSGDHAIGTLLGNYSTVPHH
jgi:hypothetical protein